ncbi:MAG TPA: hypothetical protein IGS52_14960 [Oscillatoriaceae cyanobacterium M33_DOE_052]|uniref:Uncharacterized protein n=1 Tax=Planktothricoides sp. SpSt-374 TaxID=2282167 RepID=A0A7C3ZY46_9CYAN|nr:hypothetical protein [Oscillatoriaceae cyanobacterium M33_DOE_052]
MLQAKSNFNRTEAEYRFIETLTFSNFDEIVAMLDKSLTEDWMAMPVWARNLAFRLACLQAPKNHEIRRRAAADLRCFGPDWDGEAEQLEREAYHLEAMLSNGVKQEKAF